MTYSGDFDLYGAFVYMEFEYTPPVRPTFNDDGYDEELRITYFSIDGSSDLSQLELVEDIHRDEIEEACRRIVASEIRESQIEAAKHRADIKGGAA